MQHDVADNRPIHVEITDAIGFPEENPNPVFRVAADGQLLYANRASRPLLSAWGVRDAGGALPPDWQARIAAVLTARAARQWDERCGETLYQLQCVPIPERGYVNVYATDVSARAALADQSDTLLVELRIEQRRLVESVRLAEQRAAEMEATLEAISDGVVLYAPDGTIRRANAGARRLLGYRPADFDLSAHLRLARLRAEPVAEAAPENKTLPLLRALAGETVTGELLRFQPLDRADDAPSYMIVNGAPIRDANGALLGAVLSFSDATELRRARDELTGRVEARTAELEAIFASVPDALYVGDASGILRCNAAALRRFGCDSVAELRQGLAAIAARMHTRRADTGAPLPPAELALARALRGEQVVIENLTTHPLTREEQVHRISAGPIVLNGEIIAAVALASDITEQQRTRQQLVYQADLLSRVKDAIIATDLQSRITAWNHAAEEMFGWSSAAALGQPIYEFLALETLDVSDQQVLTQVTETGDWRGEQLITRRDGVRLTVEATIVAVRDARGEIGGFVGVNRDISRRKAAEAQNARLVEELRVSREQLRALSRRQVTLQESERSYVADQLYNQVGQVLTALQFQLAQLQKQGETAEAYPQMRATLNQALRELHDLAAWLRPVGLDRAPLAHVLAAYLTEFGRTHGLRVRCDPGDTDSLRVPADARTALFRAVQEGLTNVVRHAHATEVNLTLVHAEGGLTVTLADDGVGFDAANADGVGLASIRERLEAVGGRLTIASGCTGTRLTLHAPLAPRTWSITKEPRA